LAVSTERASDVRFAAAIDTEVSRPSPLRRVRGALAAGRPDDPLAGLANRRRAWGTRLLLPCLRRAQVRWRL